jgi:hypothetical protein
MINIFKNMNNNDNLEEKDPKNNLEDKKIESDFFTSKKYRKMQIAKFYTRYFNVPTDPEEVSDETLYELGEMFGWKITE